MSVGEAVGEEVDFAASSVVAVKMSIWLAVMVRGGASQASSVRGTVPPRGPGAIVPILGASALTLSLLSRVGSCDTAGLHRGPARSHGDDRSRQRFRRPSSAATHRVRPVAPVGRRRGPARGPTARVAGVQLFQGRGFRRGGCLAGSLASVQDHHIEKASLLEC